MNRVVVDGDEKIGAPRLKGTVLKARDASVEVDSANGEPFVLKRIGDSPGEASVKGELLAAAGADGSARSQGVPDIDRNLRRVGGAVPEQQETRKPG